MGANFVTNLLPERLMLRQKRKGMLRQTLPSAHNQRKNKIGHNDVVCYDAE